MRPTIGKVVVIAGFASDALTRAGAAPLITGNRVHLLTSWLNNRKLDVNFGLSERRADSVLRYLVSKGVPLHRISFAGLGKTSPVADNKTAGGREQNRRVEVRVLRVGSATATANR